MDLGSFPSRPEDRHAVYWCSDAGAFPFLGLAFCSVGLLSTQNRLETQPTPAPSGPQRRGGTISFQELLVRGFKWVLKKDLSAPLAADAR